MITKEAAQKILGFEGNIYLKPEEMAQDLTITVFPNRPDHLSPAILSFFDKLMKVFEKVGVRLVDFEDALIKENTKRKHLKKHISVIVLGDQPSDNLPIEYITSLSDNSLVSILDYPEHITKETSFGDHFETAMTYFSHHLTNIVLGVDDKKWILYNYNASHPIYELNDSFEEHVLHSLIPKIYAPISPCKLSEFEMTGHFNPYDSQHKPWVEDFVEGGKLFSKTGLYPPRRDLESFPFRTPYHRRVAKMLLDGRNGMSYGFMARQMPVEVAEVTPKIMDMPQSGYLERDGYLHVGAKLGDEELIIRVPEVWVLSQRSGADKTNLNPSEDLLKMGLHNGQMLLETPQGVDLGMDYRPSFDTKVILGLSVGNAMVAGLQRYMLRSRAFAERCASQGLALAHWHGYFRKELIPRGMSMYGDQNPNVACSSPQSAIYALQGKLDEFSESLSSHQDTWEGDIHVEPQHGINITASSLKGIAEYLLANPTASVLGSRYFYAVGLVVAHCCLLVAC